MMSAIFLRIGLSVESRAQVPNEGSREKDQVLPPRANDTKVCLADWRSEGVTAARATSMRIVQMRMNSGDCVDGVLLIYVSSGG